MAKEVDFIKKAFADDGQKPVWSIVVGHYPMVTYGKYKNDNYANELNSMTKLILPALKAAKVDFYLAGYDHNQQVIAKNGEPFYFINGGVRAYTQNQSEACTRLVIRKIGARFYGD